MSGMNGAEIIAFYSYKGGTGRSMLLANIGWILASNGKRVLMVDWDLEAPGLHRYVRPFLIDKDLVATEGLIDLMWGFTDAAMTPVPEVERAQGWHHTYADVLPFTAAVRWSFPLPGRLDLLPAGKQGPTYSASVNSFNWQNFYERLGGGIFLESMKEQMRKEYDYVLIDSRTGVSDTAGICTVQMPDTLVMCFTANNQSIQGCASIAQSVQRQWTATGRAPARQRILPVLTRIDGSEKDKLDARREHARAIFDSYVMTVAPDAIEEYWRDVEVPYVPWYSYEEMLAAFADKYKEKSSVLDSAEALTRMLTGGTVTGMRRPSEDDRARVLKQFSVIENQPSVPIVSRTPDVKPTCPYPGTRPFPAELASVFFGREAEIDEIICRLRGGQREIYITGASGTGKSSLIAAGLRPRLERGVHGLDALIVRSLRPGATPSTQVGEAIEGDITSAVVAVNAMLARHPAGTSLLLVVDQAEEIFIHADYDEISTFVAVIRVLRSHPRCFLMFVVRADFFDVFMRSPLAAALDGPASAITVETLQGGALRAAIERPAHELGVSVEPDLISRLLRNAGSRPAAISMLQETLVQLWSRRHSSLITLADYEALSEDGRSGFEVAFAHCADATIAALSPEQQVIARRILLRLMNLGQAGAEAPSEQPLHALLSATDDHNAFWSVLQHLVDNRLVVVDRSSAPPGMRVELAHASLITAWPAFGEWFAPRLADELRRRWLDARATDWIERGCGATGLLDAAETQDAMQWIQGEPAQELGYAAGLAALAATSRIEFDKRARRRRRRVRRGAAALVALTLGVASIAMIALQHRRAEHRRTGMADLEHGRALLLSGRPSQAIPYLVAARGEGVEGPVIQMLFAEAWRSLPLTKLTGHTQAVRRATFSPDHKRVVTASDDHTARLWNTSTGRPATPPLRHSDVITSVVFSADGKRVATASYDKTAQIWDAITGKAVTLRLRHDGPVTAIAFSPDGSLVVTASADQTVRLWNAETGEPAQLWNAETGEPGAPPLVHDGRVSSAEFSSDGARIVTASGDYAYVWTMKTAFPTSLRCPHDDEVVMATFNPDGTRVATASKDHTARVWDAITGQPVTPPLRHHGAVRWVTFSPDGSKVVTASDDDTARVWNATTGGAVTTPLIHSGPVHFATFSPNGSQIMTASEDMTARVWDVATGQPVSDSLEHQGAVNWAAFSQDGTRILTASQDMIVRIWEAAATKTTTPMVGHTGAVTAISFSPDGGQIATAGEDATAHVWDTSTGKQVFPPLVHHGAVTAVAFGPGGARLVTASRDRMARIWNLRGQFTVSTLEHEDEVDAVAFSPDGLRVVTGSLDKTARVWNALTGTHITDALSHDAPVVAVSFSPNGTHVVTASYDGTARLWNAVTGKPGATLLGHRNVLTAAAFSPDGHLIVTTSRDQTARVWDAVTGRPLTGPLKHDDDVSTAAFSPDGTRVITASDDGTARVWDAATGNLVFPSLRHDGPVVSAVYSADGAFVLTASKDKTARIWDASTGKPCSPPLEHQSPLRGAAFSPGTTHIVTASESGVILVWTMPSDNRSLADWSRTAERSPYTLVGDGVSLRASE